MLELLKERLAEIVAEKSAVELKSDSVAIDELVALYRAEVSSKFAEEKAAKLVDFDLEIKALNNLIEREEAKAAIVVEAVVDTAEETVEAIED